MSVFNKHWKKEINESEIIISMAEQQSEEIKCKNAHVINGVIPGENDLQYDNQICDCRKIIYHKEPCNCTNTEFKLRSAQNQNYAGET